MMTDKPKLLFLDGKTTVKEVPLDPGEWTLGRSHSCTIQVEDTEVSGRHAVFRVTATEVWLKDEGSKNGTYLNEKLLRGEVSLTSGDLVRVGNTHLRFEAPPVDADFALPSAPRLEMESNDAATRFMAVPEEPGTRMMDGEKVGLTTGLDDGTVAFQESATRMLEASELKGLQASPKVARDIKKIVGGIVVSMVILVGVFFIAKRAHGPAMESAEAMETIHDQEGGFEYAIPEYWSRSGKQGTDLVHFKFQNAEGAHAQLDVMKETKADYELTGLAMGFNQFLEESKSRYPEFALLGQKKMELNDVALLFYAFASKDRQGKGIYLLDGNRRLVMEGHSPRSDFPLFAAQFSTILQSFKLYQPQKYFDFPVPDEAVRRLSLASPDQALQKANDHFLQGKELLRKRDVRLDNLYRAIRELQTSLQFAVALSSRPPVYREAAEELKYALQLFNEKVRRQRFEMNWALKQGDRQAAYWAVCELMQMIPEKTDPLYQEANVWMKQLTKVSSNK